MFVAVFVFAEFGVYLLDTQTIERLVVGRWIGYFEFLLQLKRSEKVKNSVGLLTRKRMDERLEVVRRRAKCVIKKKIISIRQSEVRKG